MIEEGHATRLAYGSAELHDPERLAAFRAVPLRRGLRGERRGLRLHTAARSCDIWSDSQARRGRMRAWLGQARTVSSTANTSASPAFTPFPSL